MAEDKQKRRELVATYKQSARPMGVYQIRNVDNGKIFVDKSTDLDASRHRHKFVAAMDRPPIAELHEEWQIYGGRRFVFEVLEEMHPGQLVNTGGANMDRYRNELNDLLDLWLKKLQPYGDRGYNRPKKTL
jgi:hypothetical protein